MAKRHVIISGTGRAGTTFLVQLLTELGLDTGLTDSHTDIFENCNAGMEKDLREPDAPYIVKSPFLCDYLATFSRDLMRLSRWRAACGTPISRNCRKMCLHISSISYSTPSQNTIFP
jgi:hypothetical protein